MIKKHKTKFTNFIDFNECELGNKNGLFQGFGESSTASHSKPEKKHKVDHELEIFNYGYTDYIMINKKSIPLTDKSITKILNPIIQDIGKEVEDLDKDIDHCIGHEPNNVLTKRALSELQARRELLVKQQTEYQKIAAYAGIEKVNAIKELVISERAGYFKERIAQIEGYTKIQLDKAQRDPNEISQTEMEVFNIIKKYDFLTNPEDFKNLVNSTTDKTIKSDALTLEKDLKTLGAHLTVDGIIDDKTINAVEALISKNAAAIKAYREVTGIDPIKKDQGLGK